MNNYLIQKIQNTGAIRIDCCFISDEGVINLKQFLAPMNIVLTTDNSTGRSYFIDLFKYNLSEAKIEQIFKFVNEVTVKYQIWIDGKGDAKM